MQSSDGVEERLVEERCKEVAEEFMVRVSLVCLQIEILCRRGGRSADGHQKRLTAGFAHLRNMGQKLPTGPN